MKKFDPAKRTAYLKSHITFTALVKRDIAEKFKLKCKKDGAVGISEKRMI